jgi:hypothetical protein
MISLILAPLIHEAELLPLIEAATTEAELEAINW